MRRGIKWFLIIVGGGFLLFAGCAIILAATGVIDATPATPAPARAEDVPPTAAEQPASLEDAIDEALGESNREGRKLTAVDRFEDGDEDNLGVTWKLDDSFSGGLILAGAQRDAARILQTIETSGEPYSTVTLAGTFAMQDEAGSPSESVVVQATYDRATLEAIDWEAFNAADLLREPVARGIFIHETLR